MALKVSSAKLTASPSETGWAQAYDFKPDEQEKLAKRGHFFALISTTSHEEGLDSVLAGREILTRLHEEYFGNLEGSPNEALKYSLTKIISEFSSWEDVEIACLSFVSGALYLASGGGAKIFVLRDGVLSLILQSEAGKVISASGYPELSDFYLATTREFSEIFTPGVIKGILEGKNPVDAVEAFAPSVHAQEGKGNLGAFFVKFEEQSTTSSISETSLAQEEWTGKARSGLEKAFGALKKKSIYLKGAGKDEGLANQKSKVSLTAGLLLLGLLLVSIFFGIRQKRISDFRKTYESELASARHEIQEAEELYPLNKTRARELFDSARGRVLGLSANGVEEEELKELERIVEEGRQKILGEYHVQVEDYLDLSLLTSDFHGDEMVFVNGKAIILDRKGRRVVSVAIDGKRTEIVSGPAQIETVDALAAYADRVFILADDGIYEVGLGRTKVLDEDWIGEVLTFSYAGNFYVLEKSSSFIKRYPGTGGEFSEGSDWLSSGTSVNLEDAEQWVIDGAIWVLTGGEVRKFSLGNPVQFSVSGVYPELNNISAIYTDEDLESLYILDKEVGRVVVLTKDGEYQAQYLGERIKEANQIAVSESERKIILLSGGKLLSIELMHF